MGASDTLPHTIDVACPNCSDPIIIARDERVAHEAPGYLAFFHAGGALAQYVPPRGNRPPGDSYEQAGRFYSAGTHVRVTDDREAVFERGSRRFWIRFLVVTLRLPADGTVPEPAPLFIGQELDPGESHPGAIRASYLRPELGCHRIQLETGEEFFAVLRRSPG